eukprot:5818381-Heterocapsa_arctica.AAC.1
MAKMKVVENFKKLHYEYNEFILMCKAKDAEILTKKKKKEHKHDLKEKGRDMVMEAVKQDGEAL